MPGVTGDSLAEILSHVVSPQVPVSERPDSPRHSAAAGTKGCQQRGEVELWVYPVPSRS